MKKFLRIFYSQIFNSFFPLLIVFILLKLKTKSEVAQIFLLINFANVYLLFTDYSANLHFIKNAMSAGGIGTTTSPIIIKDLEHYLGIKTLLFVAGFFVWVLICVNVPLLSNELWGSISAYLFIVGHNLNFYWMYMSSKKEHLFIVSNFVARLTLLLCLLAFIYLELSLTFLMFFVGLTNLFLALFFFKNFCRIHHLKVGYSLEVIKASTTVIKADWPLVFNNILLMSPSNCLTFFIGYVKNTEMVLVYGLAEKMFLAFRALLGVFVSSIYPVYCAKGGVARHKSLVLFGGFYTCVLLGCGVIYWGSPIVLTYVHLPEQAMANFYPCLLFFLATIVAISLNVPFYLWLMVKHQMNTHLATALLFVSALLIVGIFATYIYLNNSVITVTQCLLAAESLITIAFVTLYLAKRKSLLLVAAP